MNIIKVSETLADFTSGSLQKQKKRASNTVLKTPHSTGNIIKDKRGRRGGSSRESTPNESDLNIIVMYSLITLAKLTQLENCHTYLRVQTDSG